MASPDKAQELKKNLDALSAVASVDEMNIADNMIQSLSIRTGAIGNVSVCRLDTHDAPRLFEFYCEGLSEKARRLFAPYPLFHTPPGSADELKRRIADWKKEDDWTALNLVKENRIIGLGVLKRFRSEQVTSAIVIRDEYLKKGLGHLLQLVIVEQARLLGLKGFHIKVISDNMASVRLHEKCGFKKTRVLPPPLYEEILEYLRDCDQKNGAQAVERRIIEMVIDLTSHNPPA